MIEPRYCPKCNEDTERRASDGRCKPCEARRARARRAKVNAAEHVYADVVDDAGKVILEGNSELPPGFAIKGVSQYDKVTGRWIKTDRDKTAREQALFDAFTDAAEKLPREPLIEAPDVETIDRDLMCVYPMGDPHLGMYAWAAEAGENFDLQIAERELLGAVDHLVAGAPPAGTAIVLNLGDFFHSDNRHGTTTAGTQVDTDGRWARVLAVGIRTMYRIIDRALEKHTDVVVRNEIGNHDDHTAIMLSLGLQHHYRDNPRVQVDVSPAHFWYFEFGRCLIMSTHGDGAKMKALGGIMAADMPEAWGRTEHRRAYTGHVHHESVVELPGLVAESFRTLAPKDAWHAKQGYRSGRDMRMDVWDRNFGLVKRNIVGINQVRSRS